MRDQASDTEFPLTIADQESAKDAYQSEYSANIFTY